MLILRITRPMFALVLMALALVGSARAQQATTGPGRAAPQISSPGLVQPLNAGRLRIREVLGLPDSFCGHVIDLMIRNQRRLAEHPALPPRLFAGMIPGDLRLQ